MDVKWWFVAMTTAATQPSSSVLTRSRLNMHSHSLSHLLNTTNHDWLQNSCTPKKVKTAEMNSQYDTSSSLSFSSYSLTITTKRRRLFSFHQLQIFHPVVYVFILLYSNKRIHGNIKCYHSFTFQILYFVTRNVTQEGFLWLPNIYYVFFFCLDLYSIQG